MSENQLDERFNPFKTRANKYSHIHQTIAVVSGKGGVGKSTMTSMLASSLNHQGFNVGILDADITGPSIGHAFAIQSKASGSDIGIIPANSSEGIKIVSANMLLEEEETPVLWRGPMVANAVKEFYSDVVWGELDVLLIDMPPGTSDVALTVYQSLPLSGIVIITTPQDMVSMIVAKAIKMAEEMNVKVLGIVENMSFVECGECQHRIYPFGQSKLDQFADKYQLEILGRLPILPEIGENMDAGSIERLLLNEVDDIAKRVMFKVSD